MLVQSCPLGPQQTQYINKIIYFIYFLFFILINEYFGCYAIILIFVFFRVPNEDISSSAATETNSQEAQKSVWGNVQMNIFSLKYAMKKHIQYKHMGRDEMEMNRNLPHCNG